MFYLDTENDLAGVFLLLSGWVKRFFGGVMFF
jgi:hypothetical protein